MFSIGIRYAVGFFQFICGEGSKGWLLVVPSEVDGMTACLYRADEFYNLALDGIRAGKNSQLWFWDRLYKTENELKIQFSFCENKLE